MLGGGVLDERGVLRGERQPERRLEAALDHRAALHLQVRQVERPALDGLEDERRVQAEALGEGERLRRTFQDRHEPGVDGDLQARALPRLADPHRALADGVEDRRQARRQLLGTRRENEERALLGGLLRAEHGRVDELQPVLLGELRAAPRALDADRAHLQPDGTVAGDAGERPVRPLHDVEYSIGVAEHREDHGCASDRLGRRVAQHDPVVLQRPRLGRGAVPGAHLDAGTRDVAGHRQSHGAAGSENGDGVRRHGARIPGAVSGKRPGPLRSGRCARTRDARSRARTGG